MSHISVLKNEILEQFSDLGEGGVFVDGTLGAGGHALAIAAQCQISNAKCQIVGVDKDEMALGIAKKNIDAAGLADQFIFVHDDFKNIRKTAEDLNIDAIDGALLDLGVSSMQLDQKERGFSFNSDEALDMRMDRSQNLSALLVINHYPESQIAQILKNFGEERFARQIAKTIVEARKSRTIETTGKLVEIIKTAVPFWYTKQKIHFATRTFQAIRIEVNHELSDLDKALYDFVTLLKPGGRLAVITFHSLEDRIVKQTFADMEKPCKCPKKLPCVCGKKPLGKAVTKKPILPTDEEIKANPRSRSAKLRFFEVW